MSIFQLLGSLALAGGLALLLNKSLIIHKKQCFQYIFLYVSILLVLYQCFFVDTAALWNQLAFDQPPSGAYVFPLSLVLVSNFRPSLSSLGLIIFVKSAFSLTTFTPTIMRSLLARHLKVGSLPNLCAAVLSARYLRLTLCA